MGSHGIRRGNRCGVGGFTAHLQTVHLFNELFNLRLLLRNEGVTFSPQLLHSMLVFMGLPFYLLRVQSGCFGLSSVEFSLKLLQFLVLVSRV